MDNIFEAGIDAEYLRLDSLRIFQVDDRMKHKLTACNVHLFPVQVDSITSDDESSVSAPSLLVENQKPKVQKHDASATPRKATPQPKEEHTSENESNINGTMTPPPLLSPISHSTFINTSKKQPDKTSPGAVLFPKEGSIKSSSTAADPKKEQSEMNLPCPSCPEIFKEVDLIELIKHIRTAHGNSPYIKWRISNLDVMPLKCTYCEFSFKTKSVLEKHRIER